MKEEYLKNKEILVTGGAGVIGSEMVRRLYRHNNVTILDNLSSGSIEHLDGILDNSSVQFVRGDVSDRSTVETCLKDKDIVFNFAANGDVRFKPDLPTDLDLRINTLGMYDILEGMRICGVSEIVFSSSSTVYGEASIRPTPESYGPLVPTSLYGASKLASEGLIGGFSSFYGIKAWIYRFANITAPTSRTLGRNVVPDFIEKLRKDPTRLLILGDGNQAKSYLYVDDCIEGMLYLMLHSKDEVNIYNLGSDDTITVHEIADIVVEEMNLKNVKYEFSGGRGGWKGDVPQMFLDVSKAAIAGWKPKRGSTGAVRLSARALILNSSSHA